MIIEIPNPAVSEPEAKLAMAIGLYSDNKLTLGQAAELSGLSQGELQRELGRRKIPTHYTMEDLNDDLASVESLDPK